jgi:hypothetical protein
MPMSSCMMPDRLVLGTCVVQDALTAPTKASITWHVTRLHFDVAATVDSDVGMLACLRVGGKWSAPPRTDAAVLQERLHQYARQLRQGAGQ